ncbi:MAG TPA: thioredoxin domain-containing protein, partial [Chitinophagaceae bacterium]|nr:thioredoxin domain-containing protein [Chitinophagaceae bacterium]
ETVEFIKRELMHPEGGFYAALDADSEGEEGKFYVWKYEEVRELLKDDGIIFCDFFDIRPGGNWEGKNILWRKKQEKIFCDEKNISEEKLQKIIHKGKKLLLEKRDERVRPQTDDKIILGWNALMNTALSKAFAATGNETFRQLAIDNMQFLTNKFSGNTTDGYFHSWKNNIAKQPAFLDDYAFLIQALIQLQETTGNTDYLEKARILADYVIEKFNDTASDFFFYTNASQEDVIVRKKEVYDGAQPSGNAVMAENLHRLGLYFDKTEWREKSRNMINSLGNAIVRYPTSFGVWGCLLIELTVGTNEIVIISDEPHAVLRQALKEYVPHKIIMSGSGGSNSFPLLSGKEKTDQTSIFLCQNYSCEIPVSSIDALIALIRRKELKIS